MTTELRGEPVTVSSMDPALGYGEFELANDGGDPVAARVAEAWLELGDERQPLAEFSLYDVSAEQSVEGDEIEVGGGATLRFTLGFPRVRVAGPSLSRVGVGARVVADGDDLEAVSPVRLERRMPRLADDNIA